MNPLTNVRNIGNLNENDLKNGIFDHNLTWHSQYKNSAYIFVGGLPYDLTEGDVICVFSQYGEIVNINLVRDKITGKPQGYCFMCYEDQRSTILAVDNLNGIKLGGRTLRVDHVSEYRTPKSDEKDEAGNYKEKVETGCAPQIPSPEPSDDDFKKSKIEKKKRKKEKKEKKKKKKKKKEIESGSDTTDNEENPKSSPLIDKKMHKDVRHTSDGHKTNPSKHSDISKYLHSKDPPYKYNSKTVCEQNDKRKKHESPTSKRRDISPSRIRKRSRSSSKERDKYPSKKRRRSP